MISLAGLHVSTQKKKWNIVCFTDTAYLFVGTTDSERARMYMYLYKKYMCVLCIVFPFIVDVRLVGVPAGVTQDFSSTFLLLCLPLFFSREGFSRFFPSSIVK